VAGLIKREDIDEVRQRTDIKEVVDGYVTLKGAGLGSYKGLCPFHDERSPSFTVRPQVGRYHCFGCGEDGDVISFVQKLDHTSFHEAVEKLAARIGYELRYEDGGTGPSREEVGKRQRLLDAHKIADEFFRASCSPATPQRAGNSSSSAASTGQPPTTSASATHPRAGTRCSNTCAAGASPIPN
jgi:DNA primase